MSHDEEVCHLDHMASEDERRICVGQSYDSVHTDSRISKTVTSMLRHGQAHSNFAMDARGYVTLAQVYEAVLGSDANYKRKRDEGPSVG